MQIICEVNNYCFYLELVENYLTHSLKNKLPLKSKISLWGEEIYFKINLRLPANIKVDKVEKGDVAYWEEGDSLCIFFGKTPLSENDEPKPVEKVMVLGKVLTSLEELKTIKEGEEIKLSLKENNLEKKLDEHRILSQEEIDILVKKLLTEKNSF